MIGNYFRKIYEVRSEFDERFDPRRLFYSVFTGFFAILLFSNITTEAGLVIMVGSVLLVLSGITFVIAFSLPRKRQPLIGNLTITGFVLLLVGGIIGIMPRLLTMFG
ncbi:MAG: hypothetical protein AAGF95_21615 [Chloroflexota bacterium]